jgi:hypothetical protein
VEALPTVHDEVADGWWARRKGAFCPRYGLNFKRRHSQTQLRDLAARLLELLLSTSRPLTSEGAGNAGRRCARSRACSVESTRVSHHGHTGNTRHSPRNGLRLTPCSPRGPGSLAPVISGISSANLTPASGRQDHTSSPSASSASVSRAISVHRIPRSTSVTIAKRPSVGRDDANTTTDLGFGKREIFLRKGLDREFAKRLVGQINSRTIVLLSGIFNMFASEA